MSKRPQCERPPITLDYNALALDDLYYLQGAARSNGDNERDRLISDAIRRRYSHAQEEGSERQYPEDGGSLRNGRMCPGVADEPERMEFEPFAIARPKAG